MSYAISSGGNGIKYVDQKNIQKIKRIGLQDGLAMRDGEEKSVKDVALVIG